MRPALGADSSRQAPTPILSSAGGSEPTPSAVTDSNESGRGNAFTPLDWHRAQQARDALIAWAKENGLVDLRINPDSESNTLQPSASEAAKPGEGTRAKQPNAMPSALAELAPNLLDALALGAAGLYITHTPTRQALQGKLRSWWKRLQPKSIAAIAGKHQRVVSVFLMPGGSQPPKLVAAQINADCIDLLVEQPLSMQAPAGSPWSGLDFEPAIKAIVTAIEEVERDNYTLLLFDPTLRQDLKHIKPLANDQQALLHMQFNHSLQALSEADQQLLRQWLNSPSQTNVMANEACSAVMKELAQLQEHWSQFMPEAMANVAGVLELSIALGNLSPSYALL